MTNAINVECRDLRSAYSTGQKCSCHVGACALKEAGPRWATGGNYEYQNWPTEFPKRGTPRKLA